MFMVRELSPGNYTLWDRSISGSIYTSTDLMKVCELCVMYREMHNHPNRLSPEEMYRFVQEH